MTAVQLAGSGTHQTMQSRTPTSHLTEPFDDQGDMEEQAADMDDAWEVYHDLLQDQDNLDSAAGEDEAGGRQTEAG